MSNNDIVGLSITGILGLTLVILSLFLMRGKGANMIAGYNTMSEAEKGKFNSIALCKFMGKILLPIGITTPFIAIGEIYHISWIGYSYFLLVISLAIFSLIYGNTGNRFRK